MNLVIVLDMSMCKFGNEFMYIHSIKCLTHVKCYSDLYHCDHQCMNTRVLNVYSYHVYGILRVSDVLYAVCYVCVQCCTVR